MGADKGDPEGLYNLGISMLKVRYKGDMRMANMAGCSRAHDVTLEEFFQLTKFVNECAWQTREFVWQNIVAHLPKLPYQTSDL